MGLDERRPAEGATCGLVHDIGKIGLPAGLLEKEGPLTLEERRVMQGHSEIGERILANVDTMETSPMSCDITTSASTAMAIPTG